MARVSAAGPRKVRPAPATPQPEKQAPHWMQSRAGSIARRSAPSGGTTAGSSRSSRGTSQGVTRTHSSQNAAVSTTRSRTTGNPAAGSTVTSSASSRIGAWQASAARPSTRTVQVPHIATRHENRKPSVGSWSR